MCIRALLLLIISAPAFADVSRAEPMAWEFDVYIDDKAIGNHRFVVDMAEKDSVSESVKVISEANYKVKVLMLTVYRYQHRSEELWHSGCLQKLDSTTNDNGEQLAVNGQRNGDRFEWMTVLDENGTTNQQRDGCAKSFAYWNPSLLLKATQLINPQTGELVDVTITPLGEETVLVGQQPVAGQRYRLSSELMPIDLWYSSDDRWLALESETESGRMLRYQPNAVPDRVSF